LIGIKVFLDIGLPGLACPHLREAAIFPVLPVAKTGKLPSSRFYLSPKTGKLPSSRFCLSPKPGNCRLPAFACRQNRETAVFRFYRSASREAPRLCDLLVDGNGDSRAGHDTAALMKKFHAELNADCVQLIGMTSSPGVAGKIELRI
jgi:hypothetical protein